MAGIELESLVEKNIIEVTLALAKFKWIFNDPKRGEVVTRIKTLIFVDYTKKKPRERCDLYEPIDARRLSLRTFKKYRLVDDGENDSSIGLLSKVVLGPPYTKSEFKFAHIPMIDFDLETELNSLDEKELQDLIKNSIRDTTELKQGLLLKSSQKRNYHFIGTERLLCEEDFITFCGLCLTMCYKKNGRVTNLADSRHIGHALSPVKYMAQLAKGEGKDWSAYDYGERFLTLRITPKNPREEFPKVVGILK